jgi:solute carrier family 35 protein F3/4
LFIVAQTKFNDETFQIVAVILSNTGIALLAYMDGVAQTRTLGGVVLAAAAAAGSATYKVIFAAPII